jgi:polygalacturonase
MQIILLPGILLLLLGTKSYAESKREQAPSAHAWEMQTRSKLETMAKNLEQTLKPWPIPARVFEIDKYGAVGDGRTLNTAAIQRAIDACSASGGGVVLFPRGDYVTGTIDLKSGVMLEVAGDARILGSTNLKDYPDRVAKRKTVMDTLMDIRHSLIFAEGVERVGLRGPGTIDFRGAITNFPGKETISKLPGRPFGMRFIDSSQIVVENINLRNSPSWMQSYLNCEDCIFQKINNENQSNWNQDGLDIDGCRRVIVRDCFFNVYDDGVCIKGQSLRPTEDILIENNTIYSKCNSLKIGTDTQGDFRSIYARNLVLGGPPEGLPILEKSPTESGITLATVDGGDVEDILITNATINRASCPIFLRVGARGRLMPGMPQARIGKFRRVVIEDVKGSDNGGQGSFISGIEDGLVEDVVIRNVNLAMSGGVKAQPKHVREDIRGYPDAHQFENPLPAFGFWIRHARNIHFYNITVTPAKSDARPLFATGGNTKDLYFDARPIPELLDSAVQAEDRQKD